jgi:type IV pilus assembly protein PilE
MELLIAIAIIAILAGLAYPSYMNSVRKGHRADGKAALAELASRQEKFFGMNFFYARTLTQLGYGATPFITDNGRYSVSITSANPAAPANPVDYTIQATPLGDQLKDSCGSYTLTNTGVKGMVGKGTVDLCW